MMFTMTRINLIPVEHLSDQHLMAEYRELPRVRHLHPREQMPLISANYVLGKGHVLFFYNKGCWLEDRHARLIHEMQYRGFATNIPQLDLKHWPAGAMNMWYPSPLEAHLSWKRIRSRLGTSKRPHTWTRRSRPDGY